LARRIIKETPSRTFVEYRFLPGRTAENCTPENIFLSSPITSYNKRKGPYSAKIILNIPFMSAAMQAVTGPELAIALAQQGGIGVHYSSQPIEEEAQKVAAVKTAKAGFVRPETLSPEQRVQEALRKAKDGHSIYPIVNSEGKLLGSINTNYLRGKPAEAKLEEVMRKFVPATLEATIQVMLVDAGVKPEDIIKTAREYIPFAYAGIDLKKANELLGNDHKCLAIINRDGTLDSLVFRKDVQEHLEHPLELTDNHKRYMTAAAINTHDYTERVPALIEAGADLLVVDSSDGYTSYQRKCIEFCKKNYPDTPVMGGNIITAEAFNFLAKAGADAVKIGMGGGSICITQEQKGTGRGQATAVEEVVRARDEYLKKTGIYIPLVSDGGHSYAKDMLMAIAFGADAVMLGRIFAGCEESNAPFEPEDRRFKQYWGEGHSRSRAWREKRYGQSSFDEGVDGLIPYAGKLDAVLNDIMKKMKSTMITCGCSTIPELQEKTVVEVMSELSIQEGKAHDVILSDHNNYKQGKWG
jgi:IMP dehydrogenase